MCFLNFQLHKRGLHHFLPTITLNDIGMLQFLSIWLVPVLENKEYHFSVNRKLLFCLVFFVFFKTKIKLETEGFFLCFPCYFITKTVFKNCKQTNYFSKNLHCIVGHDVQEF